MTLNSAPWAIDGARSTAALAREAAYIASGGSSGISKPTDLKVSALAVPGNGLLISRGVAVVLNRYQTNPNQVYTVSNPATHTVLSADMPPASGSTAYYLVCLVVGDPEFDQSGHPFMPSEIAEEDAADFQYNRIVIVPCSSTTTTFDQLGLFYPAYALARLAVPPSTTTITSGMITDLRVLAQPRRDRQVYAQSIATPQSLNYDDGIGAGETGVFHDWVTWHPTVHVPSWATRATIIATMTGVLATGGSTNGFLRATIGAAAGAAVPYDEDPSVGGYTGGSKAILMASATIDVSGIAGTDVAVKLQGSRDAGEPGYVTTWGGTQLIFDVQFDEAVV
jgi:hypothetical protein